MRALRLAATFGALRKSSAPWILVLLSEKGEGKGKDELCNGRYV